MFFKKKKKKGKKIEKLDKVTLLRNQVTKSINTTEDLILQHKIEDGFINLFHAIREFFATILKIKYEFTYEELVNEIEKRKAVKPDIKEKIKKFSDRISLIEYSDRHLSEKLLRDSLREFREIVRLIFKKQIKRKEKEKRKKKERKRKKEKIAIKIKIPKEHIIKILHSLKLYKTEEEKRTKIEQKKQEKIKKEKEVKLLKKKYERTKNIEKLAEKALRYIERKNIVMAKKAYIQLNRLYQNSDSEGKAKVYDKVKDVYHEIVTFTSVTPKEEKQTKKQKIKIEKIKVSSEKINNLLLHIEQLITQKKEKKEIKKAKLLYAIGYKLYTNLSLKERKKIFPKLKKIHNLLSQHK